MFRSLNSPRCRGSLWAIYVRFKKLYLTHKNIFRNTFAIHKLHRSPLKTGKDKEWLQPSVGRVMWWDKKGWVRWFDFSLDATISYLGKSPHLWTGQLVPNEVSYEVSSTSVLRANITVGHYTCWVFFFSIPMSFWRGTSDISLWL